MSEAFASEWIAAWNAHDVERVLTHYAEDVELRSPRAKAVVPESGGIVRGKEALRAYWSKSLEASAALHFEFEAVLETVGGVALVYENHRGERVSETLLWGEDGRVERAIVAYAKKVPRSTYCVIARIPHAGLDAFQRYESTVLPLLEDHGGRLVRRLRTNDALTEVHLVELTGDDALEAYRADPRREAVGPMLVESGAIIELLRVTDVPT